MGSVIIKDTVIIIVLIMFSAYFSATETAFTSVNRIRLKNMAGEGNKKADRVLKLSDKYDKLPVSALGSYAEKAYDFNDSDKFFVYEVEAIYIEIVEIK